MQFLKTLFWVIVAVFLAILASRNWHDVTINLWGDIQLDTLSDRYTLPVVLGVTLLVTAASHRMIRRGVQRVALIALMVGLSVAFHLRSTAQFAQDWSTQTSLMWQLHWRAPALKPSI